MINLSESLTCLSYYLIAFPVKDTPKKIDVNRIKNLEKLLSNIRIKPAYYDDLYLTDYIKDRSVIQSDQPNSNSNNCDTSQDNWGNCRIPMSFWCYKNYNYGFSYGQDYIININNKLILGDGHGTHGERLSSFCCNYLYSNISTNFLKKKLLDLDFNGVITHVQDIFSELIDKASKLCGFYKNNKNEYIFNGLNGVINKKAGTTINYTNLVTIKNKNAADRRFIVAANLGDSETFVVIRDGKNLRIKNMYESHNAENIDEARNLYLNKVATENNLLPILSRWHRNSQSYKYTVIPETIRKHIDNKLFTDGKLLLFKKDRCGKIILNNEIIHKVKFGALDLGKQYNLLNYAGGTQALRNSVIQRKTNNKWETIAPFPSEDNINFGSSIDGLNQTTRGIGDFTHYKYYNYNPYIAIYEIPSNAHATVVTCSDGLSDIFHISEIAKIITNINSDNCNMAKLITEKILASLTTKLKENINYGFYFNNNGNLSWDDTTFGIIDSPPNKINL